jgi:hypothetical protein
MWVQRLPHPRAGFFVFEIHICNNHLGNSTCSHHSLLTRQLNDLISQVNGRLGKRWKGIACRVGKIVQGPGERVERLAVALELLEFLTLCPTCAFITHRWKGRCVIVKKNKNAAGVSANRTFLGAAQSFCAKSSGGVHRIIIWQHHEIQ